MLMHLRTSIRVLLLAMALTFAVNAAGTRATAEPTHQTALTPNRTRADAPAHDRDEFPLEGALIIAGIIGVVIVLAWVCSRVGDNRSAM
jgi:hypothetical protein